MCFIVLCKHLRHFCIITFGKEHSHTDTHCPQRLSLKHFKPQRPVMRYEFIIIISSSSIVLLLLLLLFLFFSSSSSSVFFFSSSFSSSPPPLFLLLLLLLLLILLPSSFFLLLLLFLLLLILLLLLPFFFTSFSSSSFSSFYGASALFQATASPLPGIREYRAFMRLKLYHHAQPPTWKSRASLYIRHLGQNLSGIVVATNS